jgi:hypothetical protein
MAHNKNQHFVPRCHLKPFTKDGGGVAINLFNLARACAISDAPVKNQSSSDYFYGKDPKLESAINLVENGYAKAIGDIFARPRPVMPGHQIMLRRFAYLQFLRTEAQARAMAEFTFAMTALPGVEIDQPSFKDAMRQSVQTAMMHYASSMKIVDDLKVCLVRNETAVPFFTSDNPAVLVNRWHQRDPRTKGRSFGVGKAGSIFVLPLSPDVLCLLYDGDVYAVSKDGGWAIARKEEDIRLLNEHQILNCGANLYFRDWPSRDDVAAQADAGMPRRAKVPVEVVTAVLGETTGWGSRYDVVTKNSIKPGQETLVHVLTNHPRPSGWPSFLSFRRGGKVWGNNTGSGYTRRWCVEQGLVSGVGYYKQPA